MKHDARREALVDRLARHLLDVGLAGASLRPLAAAAGTSDRMLLYYFKDKQGLLAVVIGRIAADLASELSRALPVDREESLTALLPKLWRAFSAPALAPYVQLWLEIAAAAGRGQEPYRLIAGQIADGFLAWGEARLTGDAAARKRDAARLLATVDGLALLAAVGRPEAASRAL